MQTRRNSNSPILEMSICRKLLGYCVSRKNKQSLSDGIANIKENLNLPFAMDVILLASWSIWIVIKNKIFNNQEARWAS
jgi:hypothetical protein